MNESLAWKGDCFMHTVQVKKSNTQQRKEVLLLRPFPKQTEGKAVGVGTLDNILKSKQMSRLEVTNCIIHTL